MFPKDEPKSSLSLFRHQFKALGGANEIQIFAADQSVASSVFDAVISETLRIEQKYSRFREDSILSLINRNAANESIEIDAETSRLLEHANYAYQLSDGLFDITSGILQKIWDFKSQKIPTQQEIVEVLDKVGWEKIEVKNRTIKFTAPGLYIDFGGFGKEYAVDQAADCCIKQGIKHGLINFAGDVKVIGPKPWGEPWRVGITHPRIKGTAIKYREMHSGALATSGDYERFKIVDGERFCHIINPKTGIPVSDFQSVSVIAETCLEAGTLSTIAMLLGRAHAYDFLKSNKCSALLVKKDGSITSVA